jgi:hypothetical protein
VKTGTCAGACGGRFWLMFVIRYAASQLAGGARKKMKLSFKTRGLG